MLLTRRPIHLLAAAALLLLGTPALAQNASGRFFLSWNAPHGQPRASEILTVSCGDSSMRDTLYLCFDPGRDSTELIAADVEIRLWPADPDTLDRHWRFESRSNPAHLLADFNLSDSPGAEPIWTASGAGGIRTVSKPDTGFIRMVWAVRESDAAVVRGGRLYAFARLIVPRPYLREACARPLCFELVYGRLAHGIRDTEVVRQGRRWVSWNPGGTAPCAERVRQSRLTPWRPTAPRR